MADAGRNNGNFEVGAQGRRRNSLFDLKLEIRRALVRHLPDGGNVYMAYAGACALAAAYPGRDVYGAEIEASMFAEGVPDNVRGWMVADCDWEFPFSNLPVSWLAGDFDHYHLPYAALRHFLQTARLAERAALFFTDTAQRRIFYYPQTIKYPDGSEWFIPSHERRRAWDHYVPDFMLPNLLEMLPDYRLLEVAERRRRNTVVWGVVVEERS